MFICKSDKRSLTVMAERRELSKPKSGKRQAVELKYLSSCSKRAVGRLGAVLAEGKLEFGNCECKGSRREGIHIPEGSETGKGE